MFFRCPLIFGLLAFCGGILCADSALAERIPVLLTHAPACALLPLGLAAAAAAVRLQGRSGRVLALLFLILCAASGWLLGSESRVSVQSPSSPQGCGNTEEDPAWHSGRVSGRAEAGHRDTVLLVDLDTPASAPALRIRLSYPTESSAPGSFPGPPETGQRIRFFARLRQPAAFGNPGGFNYLRYLAARGVSSTARLKSGQLIQRSPPSASAPSSVVRRWVERSVATVFGRPGETGLQPSGALLVACLVGERRWVDPRDEELLRQSGLGHLLAISGLHLGLLGLLLNRLLASARVNIRARRLLLMIFFGAYLQLCGPQPSITRAVVTALLYLGGATLGLHPRPLNSLSASGLAILAFNPLLFHEAGFQLSFGATYSILLLGPVVVRQRREEQSLWNPARLASTLFGVSAAVLLGIAPLQASLFHRATPTALLTNPAAGPLLGLSLTAGLVLLTSQGLSDLLPPCCSLLPRAVALLAARLVDFGFSGIVRLARLSAPISFRLPAPSPALACAYYLCLASAAGLRGNRTVGRGQWVFLLLCAAPCLLLVHAAAGGNRLPPGTLRVTVLDVGQGDSIIVECPDRRTLVIDGGGALPGGGFDFGELAVSPALWDRGLHSLEDVVLSHGHQDHAGGLAAVVRNFRPRRILAGCRLSRDLGAVQTLLKTGEQCGARLVPLHRGMVLRKGEVELVVLHPPPPLAVSDTVDEQAGNPNNNSLVLLLRHRAVRMLFTGDLMNGGEEQVLGSPLSRLIGGCQLIKVGHHGAPGAGSIRWLNQVSPRIAVVTAGRFNRFGHPDPFLRQRLLAAGCRRIHITGQDGALVVVSDGRRLYQRSGPF